MRPNLIPCLLLLVLIVTFSCNKNGQSVPGAGSPPQVPVGTGQPPDSLFSWRAIGQSANSAIIDIWFTSPSKGFYAGADGYLYESLNEGNSWSRIRNSQSSLQFPMENFFFLDQQYGFAQSANQLEITRDGGETWTLKSLGSAGASNIFFVSPSTGYYSDQYSGVHKTTDTGNTWTQVYYPKPSRLGYYLHFLSDQVGYVFSSDGILEKTANGSSSWQPLATDIAPTLQAPDFNTLLFLDNQTGFYGTRAGLFRTTDGGLSWAKVHPAGGFVNIVKFPDIHTGYYLSDSSIYKTVDGGQSWTTSCKLGSDYFFGMHFLDASTGWACTSKGRIYRLQP